MPEVKGQLVIYERVEGTHKIKNVLLVWKEGSDDELIAHKVNYPPSGIPQLSFDSFRQNYGDVIPTAVMDKIEKALDNAEGVVYTPKKITTIVIRISVE